MYVCIYVLYVFTNSYLFKHWSHSPFAMLFTKPSAKSFAKQGHGVCRAASGAVAWRFAEGFRKAL